MGLNVQDSRLALQNISTASHPLQLQCTTLLPVTRADCPHPTSIGAREPAPRCSACSDADTCKDLCCCRFFGFVFCLFLCHQLAVCLFRCMAAIGRTLVVAYTVAWLLFLLFILLGGYVLTKGQQNFHKSAGKLVL